MSSFKLRLTRSHTQRRNDSEIKEALEQIAHLPRVTIFVIDSINVEPPAQIDYLWRYQGTIVYKLKEHKRHEKPDLIKRELAGLLDRIRKACQHTRWSRFKWEILEETFSKFIEGESPEMSSTTDDAEEMASSSKNRADAPADALEHLESPTPRKSQSESRGFVILNAETSNGHPEERNLGSTPNSQEPADTVELAVPDDASIKSASQRFGMISDPTRLKILLILNQTKCHVSRLCSFLDQSQPAVSHHLALLRNTQLVEAVREGKHNVYELTDTGRDLMEVVEELFYHSLE